MKINEDKILCLEIDNAFLKNYKLYHLLSHDPFYEIVYTTDIEKFELPVKRFTFNLNWQEDYFDHFRDKLKEFLKKHDAESHLDRLLFLSLLYKVEYRYKGIYNNTHKVSQKNSKVLYNLISVPAFNISFNDARKLLINAGNDEWEVDEIIVTYLMIVSGKHRNAFVNDKNLLDLARVSKEDKKKAIFQIAEEHCIKFKMPNGKQLFVSGNIIPSIKFDPVTKKSSSWACSSKSVMEEIVKVLFEEQETNQTRFYKLLLDYDFVTQKGKVELEKSTKHYGLSSFHAFVLRKIRNFLSGYLDDAQLFSKYDQDEKVKHKDDFIYQYFVFFGLINPKIECYASMETLDRQLALLKDKRSKQLATVDFSDKFKNIPKNEETFNPTGIRFG